MPMKKLTNKTTCSERIPDTCIWSRSVRQRNRTCGKRLTTPTATDIPKPETMNIGAKYLAPARSTKVIVERDRAIRVQGMLVFRNHYRRHHANE